MALTDAQREYDSALAVARHAREQWEQDPTDANFRVWRDSSEVAIKWHRAVRLEGSADEDLGSDVMDELAEARAKRAA